MKSANSRFHNYKSVNCHLTRTRRVKKLNLGMLSSREDGKYPFRYQAGICHYIYMWYLPGYYRYGKYMHL